MIEAYNLSRVINKSLTGYDRKVRPNAGGPPVIVKIEFKVISFGEIKEANMVCLVTSDIEKSEEERFIDFQTPRGGFKLIEGHPATVFSQIV